MPMTLFFAPTSPFVRKVRVCAAELGLADAIELADCAPNRLKPDAELAAANPLAQAPTLVLESGQALYGSAVIALYLDELSGGRLVPAQGPERWTALVRQSLADTITESGQLLRYETSVRPEAARWPEWAASLEQKILAGADAVEAMAEAMGETVDLGAISLACALAYLDFRAPQIDWRAGRPAAAAWFERFAARPSMTGTGPQ